MNVLTPPATSARSISVAPVKPKTGSTNAASTLPSAPPAVRPNAAATPWSRIASSVALAVSTTAKPMSATASERRLRIFQLSIRR